MNEYLRDAIRLLFVLSEGSRPLPEPDGGATHIFRGEARLHALDFWMRYPDYLASELLDRFQRDGRAGDLDLADSIMSSDEPDLRRLPMVRYFFGAFDPIDNAISILKARELVTITGRKSGGRPIETNFLIYPKAFEVCDTAVKTAPVLGWYRDRARLVCDLAGTATGGALKDRQYERSQYAEDRAWLPDPVDRRRRSPTPRHHQERTVIMARRPKRDGSASWIANIAARTGADDTTVADVLERRRITASPSMTRPRRLTLKWIAFSGEKHGTLTEGAFDFAWSDLETGLYAILSDGNLKGKSSILHVARWLLRGSPADGFQADVKAWIRKASLQFALNETTYEVRLDEPEQGHGALLQRVDEAWSEVAHFASPAEFKSAMSEFFLRELGLDALPTWNDELGEEVVQDWTALSGALSMGPHFNSLLGEVNMAGLPTRLMQMYLGLPWVSTYCAAHVARTVLEREENERTRRHEDAQREQMTRILELEAAATGAGRTRGTAGVHRLPDAVRLGHYRAPEGTA